MAFEEGDIEGQKGSDGAAGTWSVYEKRKTWWGKNDDLMVEMASLLR